ncbi:MAG: DUF2079 domain-containing protein [Polyangiales bacterium]
MAEPIEPSAALPRGLSRVGSGARDQREPVHSAPKATPLAHIALALFELGAAGGALYLCTYLFLMPGAEREALLAHNTLAGPQRMRALLQLFGAAAVPIAIAGVAYVNARDRALGWLVRAGEISAPLILACFLPALLDYTTWYDKPLPYLVQLLGFVLVLERLLTRAFGRSTHVASAYAPASTGARVGGARVLPLAIVCAFSVGYAVYMSYYTILRHRLLGTAGFDLGIFDNLMFNALHGHPFRSTVAVPHGSYLSNHAEYGMYLFVPLYALRPGPETLLVLQSSMMGLAAIPLYLFCATQVSRPIAAALSVAYLFYAPLHGPNFYDFHWMPMAMLFFHGLFFAIAKRKVAWIIVLTAVVCSMREDAAFGTIVIGLFLIVTKYWVRLGAWMAGVSVAWFLVVKFIIMPWAGPWWFADIYKDLVAQGEHGYGSIVRTVVSNPNFFLKTLLTEAKATYALHLLAPLALIPLRSPPLGLLMLPGFIVTLMTTGYAPTVSISFQYTTTWIPFLFAAVAIALRLRGFALGPGAVRGSIIALVVGVLCHSYVFGAIMQHNTFVGGFSRVYFTMSSGEQQRYNDLMSLARLIPPRASVAATESEIPHVSTRINAYTLKITIESADYLLLNRHHLDSDARQRLKSTLKTTPYGLVARRGEFFLFQKFKKSPETDNALRSLGISPKH